MDWCRGHVIGHGSSASVSVAVSNCSGDVFAVKSAELSQSGWLQKEGEILSTLDCPQIVAYKGCDSTTENNKIMFNLMMEYVKGGTIGDAIRKHGDHNRLQESMIIRYTKQIVKGLDYLHSIGIVHCDIKPSNILLAENGDVKIADFGCAKRLNKADDKVVIGGTPLFMAPEVVRGEEQSFPADIWALGCTLIEMATGRSSWSHLMTTTTSPTYVLYKIALSGESPNIPEFLSDQAKDFLDKCFRRDPKQRWASKQLMEHPFLKEFDAIDMKQSQEFDVTSPTSILDHEMWNSEEESVTSSSDSIIQECLDNSPMQRIKKLSMNSEVANWTWEESWVTIRTNESKTSRVGGDGGEKLIIRSSSVGYFNNNAGCYTSDSCSF
ncbi:hypothetical protein LIER_22777 [Lithospermum erythrorhizon]|uniref:Protein kinase domain-containing protein n=1 Tax=Lithospermum erythrorhizon TaxID=34254 RepID=A0AAV3QYG2_LITER